MRRKETWNDVEKELEFRNGQWVEVKKRSVKVTGLSTRVKETWDIIFKFFAAAAVFTPFLILSIQSRNEIRRQKAISLLGLSSNILSTLEYYNRTKNIDSLRKSSDYYKMALTYESDLAVYGNKELGIAFNATKRNMFIGLFLNELKSICQNILSINRANCEYADYFKEGETDTTFLITKKKFIEDSASIKANIYELDNQISYGISNCSNIRRLVSDDTTIYKRIFLERLENGTRMFERITKFSDSLWHSLMKRNNWQKKVLVSMSEEKREVIGFLEAMAPYTDLADSSYYVKSNELKKLFLKELR